MSIQTKVTPSTPSPITNRPVSYTPALVRANKEARTSSVQKSTPEQTTTQDRSNGTANSKSSKVADRNRMSPSGSRLDGPVGQYSISNKGSSPNHSTKTTAALESNVNRKTSSGGQPRIINQAEHVAANPEWAVARNHNRSVPATGKNTSRDSTRSHLVSKTEASASSSTSTNTSHQGNPTSKPDQTMTYGDLTWKVDANGNITTSYAAPRNEKSKLQPVDPNGNRQSPPPEAPPGYRQVNRSGPGGASKHT